MKKRVLIAVGLVLALVLIAQTGVWADKLQVGSEAPAAGPLEAPGARPLGTVHFPAFGCTACTIEDLESDDLPAGPGANPPEGASFYELTFGTGDTLENDEEIEVEVGPGGSFFYWDGSAWVEVEVVNGEVTIPAGAPNPVITAVVTE